MAKEIKIIEITGEYNSEAEARAAALETFLTNDPQKVDRVSLNDSKYIGIYLGSLPNFGGGEMTHVVLVEHEGYLQMAFTYDFQTTSHVWRAPVENVTIGNLLCRLIRTVR